MTYNVIVKKKVQRDIALIPKLEQKCFIKLVRDLERIGPIQSNWPNYSKLGFNRYHCHLSYRWVACWRETLQGLEIEVYYVGSRESAPY